MTNFHDESDKNQPDDSIPDEFWQGIEQFNRGEYYACHDTLEAIWMEAPQPQKTFYQGVLQLAVALYHLGNLNWQGAVMLLGEGVRRLRGYEPSYSGIQVDQLVDESLVVLRSLQTTGPEQVEAIALALHLISPDHLSPSFPSEPDEYQSNNTSDIKCPFICLSEKT